MIFSQKQKRAVFVLVTIATLALILFSLLPILSLF